MKKNLLIICLSLLFTAVNAQPGARKEKVEALRIAYITKKLELSSQEAQVFWPVYNEYTDKLETARKNFRQQHVKFAEFTTDKEAEDFLGAELQLKQKEAEYLKEYNEKLKKVISVKKVARLRKAEEEFKKELLKRLNNRGPAQNDQ